MTAAPTLAEVVGYLDARYPPGTAEPWDAPGTVCGDPSAPVRTVVFAVDPTLAVVREALARGADLLVTHHPLLLRAVHSVAATTAKGAVIHELIRGGCALHCAHTNADSAPGGVADALAQAIGLTDLRPLVPAPAPALDKVVVMVPVADADRLVDVLASAGAGAVGDYERCAWTTTGTGTFRPGPGARPAIGTPGRIEHVTEARVEMVAPRHLRAAVVAALRGAHPYEEPAFDVLELAALPGTTGTGRVGRLPAPTPLRDFGQAVAAALPATAGGVRLAGDLDAPVTTVAVVGGAGDSMFAAVRAAGVDAYVTADLRHHPASEARETAEHSALLAGTDPAAGRPFLVDVSHWASEWPWLERAAADLSAALAVSHPGATVTTHVSRLSTDPWSARIASSPPPTADPARS